MIDALPPVDEMVENDKPRKRSSCLCEAVSAVPTEGTHEYLLAELLKLERRFVLPQLPTLLELPLKP